MVVIKSEFYLALNQVATERGISPEDVLESIKSAIIAAYVKDLGKKNINKEKLKVTINPQTGETRIFFEGKDVTPAGFGRIAAQTARQVILQKIREAEKRTIAKHYSSQVGSLIKGRIIRKDKKGLYVDIGKAEALLPYEEQIKNEKYNLNDVFVFYLKEIKTDEFGNWRIIVSRTDPGLVEELFRREVPEIANGTVKIKKVVRYPGERAKIAVYCEQGGVDPVGACVGQKGIRVKAVTDQLGGEEKIDIIQWNKNPSIFIQEALSPAKISSVEVNEKEKRAKIYVEEKEAALAIGKGGINIDLATRLTGYQLDIVEIKKEKTSLPSSDQKEENKNKNKTN